MKNPFVTMVPSTVRPYLVQLAGDSSRSNGGFRRVVLAKNKRHAHWLVVKDMPSNERPLAEFIRPLA